MTPLRIRIFAGPNGSGKTTFLRKLLAEHQVNLGVYVNADDIEAALKADGQIDFSTFRLQIDTNDVQEFFKKSRFSPIKRREPDLWNKLKVENNVLLVKALIDSYLAADIAEMLRQKLLSEKMSFTYETVMSHPSKIDFMRVAREQGYKVYLYFITTQDPEININRVSVRIAQAGHSVHPETIQMRYYKSMSQLKSAVAESNKAYLFDNSGEQARLIAQINEGSELIANSPDETMPHWIWQYLIGK